MTDAHNIVQINIHDIKYIVISDASRLEALTATNGIELTLVRSNTNNYVLATT